MLLIDLRNFCTTKSIICQLKGDDEAHDQAAEAQCLHEDEDQDHADEEVRLLGVRANIILDSLLFVFNSKMCLRYFRRIPRALVLPVMLVLGFCENGWTHRGRR